MRLPSAPSPRATDSGAMLARAMALFVRVYGGDHSAGLADQEELCRAALPLEEERGDPRRLALLWSLLAYSANFRMQNDEHFVAAERALHYSRVAGDSPSDTAGLDLALILGPRPADEALRALDEIDAGCPPGAIGSRAGDTARDARPQTRHGSSPRRGRITCVT